jgi:valyl-tRNA synthetase
MVTRYPEPGEPDERIMADFALAIEAIVSLRRCKTLVEKANQRLEKAYVKFNADLDTELMRPFIEKLAKVDRVEFVSSKPEPAVTDVSDHLESYISTAEIDMGPILAKLEKQKAKLEKEIMKLSGMLNNEKFVANAPEQVIAQNRQALAEAEQKLEKVKGELERLNS